MKEEPRILLVLAPNIFWYFIDYSPGGGAMQPLSREGYRDWLPV